MKVRQWRLLHCEHEAACFIGKLGGELKNDAFLAFWGGSVYLWPNQLRICIAFPLLYFFLVITRHSAHFCFQNALKLTYGHL
jgi:hypothetical protein